MNDNRTVGTAPHTGQIPPLVGADGIQRLALGANSLWGVGFPAANRSVVSCDVAGRSRKHVCTEPQPIICGWHRAGAGYRVSSCGTAVPCRDRLRPTTSASPTISEMLSSGIVRSDCSQAPYTDAAPAR